MLVSDLVTLGKTVTEIYINKQSTWNPFEAIAHAHAELSEIWDVLRNKENRYGKIHSEEWYECLAEETADGIISAMTAYELVPGTTNERLIRAIERKIDVVMRRAINYESKVVS